jgi:hypothetical protein
MAQAVRLLRCNMPPEIHVVEGKCKETIVLCANKKWGMLLTGEEKPTSMSLPVIAAVDTNNKARHKFIDDCLRAWIGVDGVEGLPASEVPRYGRALWTVVTPGEYYNNGMLWHCVTPATYRRDGFRPRAVRSSALLEPNHLITYYELDWEFPVAKIAALDTLRQRIEAMRQRDDDDIKALELLQLGQDIAKEAQRKRDEDNKDIKLNHMRGRHRASMTLGGDDETSVDHIPDKDLIIATVRVAMNRTNVMAAYDHDADDIANATSIGNALKEIHIRPELAAMVLRTYRKACDCCRRDTNNL